MKYIKEFDSLRAIAIIIVIIGHWHVWKPLEKFLVHIDGVAMFFVLSGFLITNILIGYRKDAELTNTEPFFYLRAFIVRRALRIFPVYYFLLLFLFLTGYSSEGWIYYLTYTSNYYIYSVHLWGAFTHLWSLSVEEQFYLVWPWMILLINKKFILPVILIIVSVGLISRFFILQDEFAEVLTVTCLSSLGLGSILAWIINYKYESLGKCYFGLALCALLSFGTIIYKTYYFEIFLLDGRLLTSIITCWLIVHILLNKDISATKKFGFLKLNVLASIGKISYSLYLFHYTLPNYTRIPRNVINRFLPEFITQYTQLLIHLENFALLLVCSIFSYYVIEMRFLRLKKFFDPHKSLNSAVLRSIS